MYIIDNIIFSLQKSGGISAVWYEHLKRLLNDNQINDKLEFVEYDSAKENIFRGNLKIDDSIINHQSSKLLRIKRYINPSIKTHSAPYIFHSSYYRTSRDKESVNITTVHDFTYEYFSNGLPKLIHCKQKYLAIRNSDLIICISENTKKDLLRFLPDIPESRIRVVYNGVSDDYHQLDKFSSNLFSGQPFALFVGARDGYKNFSFAVEALANSFLSLVVVGAPLSNNEIEYLESKLGSNRYKYEGRVSNADLNKLYNSAFCLLYPSSYEGFGIPVIEAQKAGCPVIAANCSSIPEIVGDKTLLINEYSSNEIKKKINILKNPRNRDEIIHLGIENSRRFSWDDTYANTMKVYQDAADLINK